jgi:hypothetical protein
LKIENLQPTLVVLKAWQGKPLNFSTLGKELGISYKAVQTRLRCLAESQLVWLLKPLPLKGRKSPKLYLTETGECLWAGGPQNWCRGARIAPQSPALEFRSRMIRAVCSLETARSRASTFWYYGGYGKTHVELIIQTHLKRIGFVFLEENRLSRWCWSYCRKVFRQDIIQAAFVLYPGRRIFYAADRVVALPTGEFLENYRRWLNACLGSSRKLLQRMVREYNREYAHLLP